MTDKTLQVITQPTGLRPGTAPVDWQRAVFDWLANLGSDRTRRAYKEVWAAFVAFTQAEDFASVTQSDVIAYRLRLETFPSPKTGKPYSQSTINQHLSALSSFYRFAADRGLRPDNPVEGVKRKAVNPYGKATWLDPEERQDVQLLQAVDATTPQGKRDRAILLLFLTSALRVGAFGQLKVGSLRRQGVKTFLTYTNKGGETVEVELAPETAQAVEDYLATRDRLTDQSPLFVATEAGQRAARNLATARGDQVADEEQPLTDRAIRYLVKSYCDKAFGKGHGIHPHSLRHTAAQVAIHEGLSVTEVSRLLKHRSLGVTTIYIHATSQADRKIAATMGQRYATV